MANQRDQIFSRENNVRTSLDQNNRPASARNSTSFDDDVIASLLNAKENRRARQVAEWETLRRRAFRTSV
jgi:hypothetical protein